MVGVRVRVCVCVCVYVGGCVPLHAELQPNMQNRPAGHLEQDPEFAQMQERCTKYEPNHAEMKMMPQQQEHENEIPRAESNIDIDN